MAKPSIADEIVALIPIRVGSRPWHEKLNEEQAAMVAEIHAAWLDGRFGKARRTAAKAIASYLNKHGITVGYQGVDAWLAKSPTT